MKKGIKLLALSFVMLLFTGCVKYNVDMTINSDKSMDFKLTTAMADSVKSYFGEQTSDGEKDKEEAKNNGFDVEDYKEDGYTGYTVKKHYNNIDDLSTTEDVTANISTNDKDVKLFKINKGFLSTTYKATFKSDSADSITSQTQSYKDNESYKEYMKGFEVKFVVNLPSKAKSNNATNVSNDGKTLEWDLTQTPNVEFEFEMTNTTNLIIVIVAAIVVIGGAICVVAFVLKKKKDETVSVETKNDTKEEK